MGTSEPGTVPDPGGTKLVRVLSRDAPTVWAGTGWSPTSQLAASPATNVKDP